MLVDWKVHTPLTFKENTMKIKLTSVMVDNEDKSLKFYQV
jgi:hypothetical protein